MLEATGLDETPDSVCRELVSFGAAEVPGLAARWAVSGDGAAHDRVEVVTGAAAVARRFLELRLGASEEVCALVPARPVAVTGASANGVGNAAAEGTAGRGVVSRVVVERSVLDLPEGRAQLASALGGDEQVRVAERLPTGLVVADRTVALLPLLTHPAEPAALWVRASGPVRLLQSLFESAWRDALPLGPGPGPGTGTWAVTGRLPDGPDATDLEMLSLLLAGLTDASVARQLDLGLRTVQRRVKRLMELTGATTRLQLGWQARERGWAVREKPW